MRIMRSTNPILGSIERNRTMESVETASYAGITMKTITLLGIAVLSGFYVISQFLGSNFEAVVGLLIPSFIIALVAVIVASFVPRLAMPFSIVYALAEGVILGFITIIVETMVPGAAILAVIGTATVFTVMLFLYTSRTIRVTSGFRRIMLSILFSILIFFVIFSILNMTTGLFISANPMVGIGISLFLIVFGGLMLALDFDRAEAIVEAGADKRYEWIVALGLMVTIVWIYFEILRLVLIISSRRN
jgi:uncharacterized YccA/Bax inhibitor family protein